MLIDTRHQSIDVQPAAAGQAEGRQGGNINRCAHGQGQINTGDVFQQGGQRKNAQVLPEQHPRQALLQGCGGGCHLLGRQTDPFGRPGAAGRKGHLCSVLRHQGTPGRHAQLSQPKVVPHRERIRLFSTEQQAVKTCSALQMAKLTL